jgi:hypothetical protein
MESNNPFEYPPASPGRERWRAGRTAEQETAERRSNHFVISASGEFDILRFKETAAQMKSIVICFLLDYRD